MTDKIKHGCSIDVSQAGRSTTCFLFRLVSCATLAINSLLFMFFLTVKNWFFEALFCVTSSKEVTLKHALNSLLALVD
jgi:hypothetical protein